MFRWTKSESYSSVSSCMTVLVWVNLLTVLTAEGILCFFLFLLSSSVFSSSIFPNWVLLSLSLFISVGHHILLLLQQKSSFHWAHGINLKSEENLLLVPEAALKRELEEQRFAHSLWLLNSSYFLVFFPPCLWEIFGWMPLSLAGGRPGTLSLLDAMVTLALNIYN